jgi:uncharacterized protein (DUF983 family)
LYLLKSNFSRLFKIVILGLCPNCVNSSTFTNLFITKKKCEKCSENYSGYHLGDADTFFVILIVGIIIMGGVLYTEFNYKPDLVIQLIIWVPMTILLSLLIKRPVKSLFLYSAYEIKRSNEV